MTSDRRKTAARTGSSEVPAPRWQRAAAHAVTSAPGIGAEPWPAERDAELRAAVTATRGSRAASARRLRHAEVTSVLAAGGPQIVYQPQLSLSRMVLAGYEALARFPGFPGGAAGAPRGTHSWFSIAHELGLGDQLELQALRSALAERDRRPAGTTLAVNLSPAVLTLPSTLRALPDDLSGIEIELTEHEWAPGNGRLRRDLDRLRERGARIAIDDVGEAHSGLRRVMELAPDRIKLDRHLVMGVSVNTAKAALIKAVVEFAEHVRSDVCAEGVENLDDLEALAELDVGYAQGWAIGRPDAQFVDVDAAAALASADSLRGLLAGPVPATFRFDAAIGVEHLLSRLASVTSLTALARLASSYAGVLGADKIVISVITPDGSTLRTLDAPATASSDSLGEPYLLADYPVTDRALQGRTIAPIYLDGGSLDGGGDEAEWDVLREMGMQSALLVPVISRDVPIGLLECYGEGAAHWSRRQIRSARTVAAMLGPVLDTLQRP